MKYLMVSVEKEVSDDLVASVENGVFVGECRE